MGVARALVCVCVSLCVSGVCVVGVCVCVCELCLWVLNMAAFNMYVLLVVVFGICGCGL